MDYPQLLKTMQLVANDPPSRAAFRLKHKQLIDLALAIAEEPRQTGKPIMPTSSMVALQVTLFDNWPGGAKIKNKPHRYKLQFKAWDGDPSRVSMAVDDPTFVGDAELLTAAELVEKAHGLNNGRESLNPKRKKKLVKNPISEEYSVMLETLALEYPESLFAMVKTKMHGDGTTYHHGQIARVVMDGAEIVEGELYLTTERLDLPAFLKTYASGKPLKRPSAAQSRFSPHTRHAGWRS